MLDLEDVQLGDLIITEIMNNPSAVGDSEGEWFEIYNNGSQDININGLEIGSDVDVDDVMLCWCAHGRGCQLESTHPPRTTR